MRIDAQKRVDWMNIRSAFLFGGRKWIFTTSIISKQENTKDYLIEWYNRY